MGQAERIWNRVALVTVIGLLAFSLTACSSGVNGCAPCCNATSTCDVCEPCPERPPDAQPGETWCKVWSPPVTKMVEEKVCVCPAKKRTVYVPPEYGTRVKLVCVKPPVVHEVVRPGVWTTREKDVLECPERECWQRECCKPECGEVRGECGTLVKKPAVWRKELERICVSPPQKSLEFTPAEYKCVEERILVKEGFCEEHCIPAEFETRTREIVVKPGCWEWVRRPDCDIPEEALPALEVTMEDSAADGSQEGIFRVGSLVRYDLTVLSDAASMSMPDLRVVFELPEHLSFVEGRFVNDETTISGEAQSAQTAVFPLGVGEEKKLFLIARVLSAPDNNLVQLSASVQMKDGTELAIETESTTLTSEADAEPPAK